MMIVLSSHDISRLTPECRTEIQRIIFERAPEPSMANDDPFAFDVLADDYSFEASKDFPPKEEREVKRVVSITLDEAKGLIANVSDKSLHTLRLFADGQPIALNTLVGTARPYENLTDLKRSFVGAVTRRLRTVTRNKQAGLFLQTSISDGANKLKAITVRPASAEALRTAMSIPERKIPE